MTANAANGLVVELYKDAKTTSSWIYRKYGYAKNPGKYFTEMKEKARILYARRKSVGAEANNDRRMELSTDCQDWILRVNETNEKVQKLEIKYRNVESLLPWSRINLSRRMVKMSRNLEALWEEGRSFERRTVVQRSPERGRPIRVPKTKDMPSLHDFVDEIINFLNDGEVKRIGLWGKQGIGKTTIMQNLSTDERIVKIFGIVIWVTVPKDWSIEKLQHVIARELKLTLEDNMSTYETACKISENLKGRRYLLLLDEVRGFLDLNDLGITNNQMDSKVVLAARDSSIYAHMEINQQINVLGLSPTDAWTMFREIVGSKINNPGIEPIARQVVRECAHIPLLIDRIARTFSGMNGTDVWREGLNRLKIKPSKFQGMDEFLDSLSICYECLENDRKICFLYSALYSSDCQIYEDYLLECWKAQGLACEEGHTILDDLVKVSLLESGEKRKHIKMNRVLRDMALQIALQKEDSKFLVKTHEELAEPPDKKDWVPAKRISLMDNKLCKLPDAPACKNLLTLLLQRNSNLEEIPKKFFRSMENLQLLDLHRTGIRSLPASLSSLRRLKALYLNSCKDLKVLPSIVKELKDLEVLDIRGTKINNLPREIVKLIRLRCLRVSSSNFGVGCPEVISTLSSLEELSIDVDSHQLWDEVGEAITEEVAKLEKLTSLTFCFPRVNCLQFFISRSPSWGDNLFKFQFFVGYHDPLQYTIVDRFEYEINKCLKVVNGVDGKDAISAVLAKSYAFELIGHKGVLKLSDFGSMNQMRGCLVEGCHEIETIIDGNTITEGVLKFLEKMYIENVSKLESIWEGPVHTGSLILLTTLTLWNCPKLKKLFSNGMIQQLSKLQHLSVKDCPEIEEMIMQFENRGLDSNALPRLKKLELSDLPKLESIWVNDSLEWSSLETIEILTCNLLMKLPFNNDNATKLKSIKCQQPWWDALPREVAIPRLNDICNFI